MRCAASLLLLCALPAQDKPGYTDTPMLPGSKWHVHDKDRPHPPVVTPAPPAEPCKPPADAVVLFDGTDLKEWKGAKGAATWQVDGGAMTVNRSGDIETQKQFGDIQLHLEFATPAVAKGTSQERGNSGVFLMGRFEVQVLDSYDNETYADGQCAALYGQQPPDVNACRKPGEWQSYDIVFEAPRFAEGKLVSPAMVTVFHNGVLVHHRRAFLGPTAHRSLPKYEPQPEQGPIRLQDHGDPVRYRNIWLRPLPPPKN